MPWERSRPPMPQGWARRRARVLAASPNCRRCGAPASHVDHIRPRSRGGGEGLDNLQPLCSRCHGRKTQAESVAARKPIPAAERQRRLAVRRGRKQEAELWREIQRRS